MWSWVPEWAKAAFGDAASSRFSQGSVRSDSQARTGSFASPHFATSASELGTGVYSPRLSKRLAPSIAISALAPVHLRWTQSAASLDDSVSLKRQQSKLAAFTEAALEAVGLNPPTRRHLNNASSQLRKAPPSGLAELFEAPAEPCGPLAEILADWMPRKQD